MFIYFFFVICFPNAIYGNVCQCLGFEGGDVDSVNIMTRVGTSESWVLVMPHRMRSFIRRGHKQ